MRKILALVVLIAMGTHIGHSQDLSLYFMDGIWQKSLVAPAHDVEGKRWSFGLTGIGLHLFYQGPGIKDWGRISGDSLKLSPTEALPHIGSENGLLGDVSYETFHVSYLYREDLRFSLNYSLHRSAELQYPGDLARLLIRGNGSYLNRELQVGMGVHFTTYSALGLSAMYKVGAFDIGGRLGILFGGLNLLTKKRDLSLYTSEDYYQLRLTGDYELSTSGLPVLDGISSFNPGSLFGILTPLRFSNPGLALSAGVSYHPSEVLTIDLSVRDLGFIRWGNVPRTYRIDGQWEFDGLDVFNIDGKIDSTFLEDLSPDDVRGWIDSLTQLLNPRGPDKSNYNTALPLKIALSGVYQLTDHFTVGALYRFVNGPLVNDHQMAIDATYDVLGFWRIGAMYSLFRGKQNIGIHSNMNLGPVQLYLATDRLFSIGQTNKTYAHIRGGINIAF